jgi:predicted permease
MLNKYLARLRYFFSRRDRDELDEELRYHLDHSIQLYIGAGMSPQEAHRQAMIDFGGVERTRDQCYRQIPGWWMETVLQDVRYALRGFRRNPVFAVAAIATLALGIGATTAVFSVVDRILFRSLPFAQDDRLVSLGLSQSLEKQEFTLGGFFYEWRDNQKPFSSVTFEQGTSACNLTEANPVHLECADVAQNFLPTLGISPEIGRNFLPEEDLPNGPLVAMISDGLWLARYNRDPGVIDKSIEIDRHRVRIVGVLPKKFEMPRLQAADIIRPAQMDVAAQHTVNSGIGYPMWAFARLKPGVSVSMARAQMEPLFLHTQQWIPSEIRKDFHLQVRSVRDRQMQDAYAAAWVLLGGVLAVLLIACANVGSLFSARGAARVREAAVRSALGASRGRLMRQTMTEALLVAVAGAAGGLVLAEVLLRVFIAIAPTGVPFLAQARLDLRILGFTIVVSLICAAAFGILPAIERPRAGALVARQAQSRAHARLRRVLVAAQIAISVVLLSSAGLLVTSFWNIERQSLGMQTNSVLTVHIPLNHERYPAGYMDFYLRAEAALRRLPGVTAVGMADSRPPDGWNNGTRFSELMVVGGKPTPPGIGGTVITRKVTPGYFRVLQIPIIEGPGFTEEERHSKGRFMILSKDLAARLFPAGGAIGQHIAHAQFNPNLVIGPVDTVVGVAAKVKNAGLSGSDEPELYELGTDQPDTWSTHHYFLLGTSLPTSVMEPWIRAEIGRIDPIAPVEIDALSQVVSKLADRPRFETALVGFFAACGLLMAIIGLYGVIAFMAAQRTQEIGVRMALGATRTDILSLIAGEGIKLIVTGTAVGLAVALIMVRLLKSLLYNVGPYDPVPYVIVIAVLAVVALAATLIPARTAMRVEPVIALRYE